jgi:sugar transferase EpsL
MNWRQAYSALKRAMDIAGAIAGLILAAPIMGLAALAVWLDMGRPVVFRQRRLGLRERPFVLMKFRTMRESRNAEGKLDADAQRLTPVGAFLRRTSIDELPQLVNVLRGDMSLVGPRPLFVEYLEYYSDEERKRHSVRPGITGLAQVSGRNHLLWDERLALDVQYVDRLSLRLDLLILGKTVLRLLHRDDVIVIPGSVQGPLTQCRAPRSINN